MQIQNVTIQELEQALAIVNNDYEGNLRWATQPRHVGKTVRSRISFRLSAVDCRKKGGRLGFCRTKSGDRRRLGGCACWHAHGHFFEALYEVNGKALIRTASTNSITGPTSDEGNWKDRNIGSAFDPAMFSELCDC